MFKRTDDPDKITVEFKEAYKPEYKPAEMVGMGVLFLLICMIGPALKSGAVTLAAVVVALPVWFFAMVKTGYRTGFVSFINDGSVIVQPSTSDNAHNFMLNDIQSFEMGETKAIDPTEKLENMTTISVYIANGSRLTIGRNCSHPDNNIGIMAALKQAHADAKAALAGYI